MKNWPSFEQDGYSTKNPLLRRIWRVSRILNVNPFGDEIKALTYAQMTFILRMYAEDHPDEFSMIDPEILRGEGASQLQAEWFNRLRGRTAMEFARSPALFMQKYYGKGKN
jgi:hypothetical protein